MEGGLALPGRPATPGAHVYIRATPSGATVGLGTQAAIVPAALAASMTYGHLQPANYRNKGRRLYL